MQRSLYLFFSVLVLTIGSFAQTAETFDIATFTPPSGWSKQVKTGAVVFTTGNEQKGTFAIVTLYRSGESSGSAKSDFENDWQEFIAGQLGVKTKPQMEPAKKIEGWELIGGGAAFENELGPTVVMLNTFSGYGRSFSFAAVFNSQDAVPAIEGFIASIKLRKPEIGAAAAPSSNSDANTAILGTWLAGASGTQRYDDYKNPHSVNDYGYSKAQYTFNSNGTYSFHSKTFRMTFDKILLVRENGTYLISGNQVTVIPQKSVIEAWSKKDGTDKWGRRLASQNRTLEKVTYQFTRHYFSGIQLWNLVLQTERATERDGPFSSNTTFSNAWYYAPPSPNNTAVELPN